MRPGNRVDFRAWVGSAVLVRSFEHDDWMVEPLGVPAVMRGEFMCLLTTGASLRR